MSWTDERVETLKKMWGEGQSASQIAKELGGVTRNAVIGKVHRLGLSNRAGSGGAAAKAAPKEKPAPVKMETKAAVKPKAPAPSKAVAIKEELDENGIRRKDPKGFAALCKVLPACPHEAITAVWPGGDTNAIHTMAHHGPLWPVLIFSSPRPARCCRSAPSSFC